MILKNSFLNLEKEFMIVNQNLFNTLMKKPEIIFHAGKEIIYLDFTNMRKPEEIIQLEDEGSELIQRRGFNSSLTLTNMEGMYFNNDIRNHFSNVVKGNTPYVKGGAVIGLNGLISIMYNSFVALTGRNIKSFKSKEEALNYLISL